MDINHFRHALVFRLAMDVRGTMGGMEVKVSRISKGRSTAPRASQQKK